MIKNERQYRITKAQANNFAKTLERLSVVGASERAKDPLRFTIQEDALRSQLDDLQVQLDEYEAVRANPGVIEISSFDQLPRAIIQARIASGLSQQELAGRLGLKEQQIQRYEATEYAGVSIDRIKEIVEALGVEVRNELLLPTSVRSVGAVFKKLQAVGLDRSFVERRLLPSELRACVTQGKSSRDDELASRIARTIGRIFNWNVEQFFEPAPLSLDNAILSAVRYKRPERQPQRPPSAYTIYAHYLALLVLHSKPHVDSHPRERDPKAVYGSLRRSHGEVSLVAVLDFLWERGIPVVPLRDPGAFHGAWWRVTGQDVVVVKQRTSSEARWVVDILHEYYHAIDEPEDSEDSIVENEDVLTSPASSEVERRATAFAIAAALNDREEELAQACVRGASGKVEWLKTAVPRVAKSEGVDPGLLANCLAYRLSFQNINWWPTAHRLQPPRDDPRSVAAQFLRTKIAFDKLAPLDRELLETALNEG